jgi:hypothetical protein
VVVFSHVCAEEIGMCALGGALFPDARGGCSGVHVVVGDEIASRRALVPITPGLIREVPIASAALIEVGNSVRLHPDPGVVALDGEREFALPRPVGELTVALNPRGPRVVEIGAALRAGARGGAFVREMIAATHQTGLEAGR